MGITDEELAEIRERMFKRLGYYSSDVRDLLFEIERLKTAAAVADWRAGSNEEARAGDEARAQNAWLLQQIDAVRTTS